MENLITQFYSLLFIKIKSPTQYLLFNDKEQSLFDDREDTDGNLYDFGEKVETPYGGFYIVPNDGKYAPKPGTNIKIAIIPVRKLINLYTKNGMF